ncbi:hypothetical protein V6582_21945 [Agrobacterium vitis]|uniref:hypothetical protein n=1 Tax=Agrobacterium vitis TaxID=373 RepID=UPI0012E86C5E|nr:hypothetical protein [Agrobacterium vitis]MVA26542.1 hypothetical protein [Agrobacterium vitis]
MKIVFDPVRKAITAQCISLLLDDRASAAPLLSLPMEECSNLGSAVAISDGMLVYSRELVKAQTVDEFKQAIKGLVKSQRVDPR